MSHCCICSRFCHHIGGPWYCPTHDPGRFVTVPAYERLGELTGAPPAGALLLELLERVNALEQQLAELTAKKSKRKAAKA